MEPVSTTANEFARRKRIFAWRGILPMLLLILLGCVLMVWGLPHNDPLIVLANLMIFFAGTWLVIAAKRYYRCPVCEKMVVPTKKDGTPSEISFGIDFKPRVCPYCKVSLR